MPSKKKKSLSGIARAKRAREAYALHKKRSIASTKAAITRQKRAREGVYGKLEQRAQLRRDRKPVLEQTTIIRRQKAEIEKLEQEVKSLRKMKRAIDEISEFDRYNREEFSRVARKHGLTLTEVYTLWLYH